ncbi:MAG: glycosyltransferase family 4 protein [Methylococcales bacterium]|nr:glycosyltransferase family 4 protein [Methylococcales bacterium]
MNPTKNKPIIGLIVPSLAEGGGVASVANFVKDTVLRSGFYDLKVISLATSFKDPCNLGITQPASWLRGASISKGTWNNLPFIHVGAVAGELEFLRYFPRKILTETVADCDILQVVCGSTAWANSVCGLGKPVAVQVATSVKIERRRRDASPKSLTDWWRKGMTAITDQLENRALHIVDAIQVENLWMLEYARQFTNNREVDLRYAPPGVDIKKFHPLTERLLSDDAYILCVGRLSDPRKNIGLLLEAYARMPQSVQQKVRLVLAGFSEPPDNFWQRSDELKLNDRVIYIKQPTNSELVGLYQKAMLFALPSDEEGLGLVLLEAMACGVPVVSTRSGGPDGIITDEKDGFLVPLNDTEALANRLVRLCVNKDLNQYMGNLGRATVEKNYTEEVASKAFLDMWDKMLTKSK